MVFEIICFALIGLIAGTKSGLLGIGGGIITIPCLLLVFHHIDLPSQSYMHLAIGTSLAAMVFNTLSASYAHYKKQAVLFSIVKPMAIGLLLGSLVGATIARWLSSHFLQIFFGGFECLLGIHFLLPEKKIKKPHVLPKSYGLSGIAFCISTFSTMLGIGGGLINIYILNFFNVPLKKAIGTTAILSFLITFLGAILFLVFGMHATSARDSVGFIYIPAFITISVISFFVAPYGAKLAHKLPTKILKRIFGAVLILAGIIIIIS